MKIIKKNRTRENPRTRKKPGPQKKAYGKLINGKIEEQAEESDDESIAPPDEPPPNVPEDAVALAE